MHIARIHTRRILLGGSGGGAVHDRHAGEGGFWLTPRAAKSLRIGLLALACAFTAWLVGARSILGSEPEEAPIATYHEDFGQSVILVDGQEARVFGFRTETETVVSLELPTGVSMLTTAVLLAGDERLSARTSRRNGQTIMTWFPATTRGSSVELELGAIAIFGAELPPITVSMADVLDEADGNERFAIPPEAVINGDPARIISGAQGRYGDQKWIQIEVVGNWQSTDPDALPHMLDGKGVNLPKAHMISGYRKDDNGVVSEGTSEIGYFITGKTDLRHVTLLFSPSTVPTGQEYVISLSPQ